jgi:hypothetical protein
MKMLAKQRASGLQEKGQGLCPWTPLGFETPNPQIPKDNVFKGLLLKGQGAKPHALICCVTKSPNWWFSVAC